MNTRASPLQQILNNYSGEIFRLGTFTILELQGFSEKSSPWRPKKNCQNGRTMLRSHGSSIISGMDSIIEPR